MRARVTQKTSPGLVTRLLYLVCEPIIEDLGTWTVGAISADQILGVAEFVW